MTRIKLPWPLFLLVWFVFAVIPPATAVYVAWHFITKFW